MTLNKSSQSPAVQAAAPTHNQVFCLNQWPTLCIILIGPRASFKRTDCLKTCESPGEIKRREVSWTLVKKLHTFTGPGEINRWEVCWTLVKKLNTFTGPGEIKRREVCWTLVKKLDTFTGPGEIKRCEVCWTLKLAQKRSRAGRWSWTLKAGLVLLQLFLNSSAMDTVFVTLLHTAVETETVSYTSYCTMERGHCLNTSIVLAVVPGV